MKNLAVIIPAFNAGRYIEAAIESVLASLRHCTVLETVSIIVIDDGSEDDTVDRISSLPYVTVFCQHNAGPAAARNTGVQAAPVSQRSLLAFLDADDLWSPLKTKLQYAQLVDTPELDAVFGLVDEFLDENDDASHLLVRPLKVAAPGFLPGAMMIRAEAFMRVGLFDETLRAGEFIDWLSRAKDMGFNYSLVSETVLLRRVHSQSLMHSAPEETRNYTAIIKAHLDRKRNRSSS